MNKLKAVELPKGKFFEFVLFHLTPAGWRLKKLAKAGYLQFRRDERTGESFVFPTKKAAELLNSVKGENFCLECVENPRIKNMRHHTFLVEIGLKFRQEGYLDYKLNPLCPHDPERNFGADALLTIGRSRFAVLLDTHDIGNRTPQVYRQEFRSYEENRNFDGVLYFNENIETMRFVIGYARTYHKIRFVDLGSFMKRGMEAEAVAVKVPAGDTIQDFFHFIEIILDLKN